MELAAQIIGLILGTVVGFAVVAVWYWGIPYLVFYLFPTVGMWKTFFFWYLILVIRLLHKNFLLNVELKKFKDIKSILKGRK